MKKASAEYTGKKKADLVKEEVALRNEIAKLQLETKTNPAKDSNAVFKKRKQLAVLLTVKNQKTE